MHERAEKLRGLSDDKKVNELINILKRDAKAESEFLSNPIEVKEDKLFAIPNYGSAMAPFYTVLALLSVEVKSFEDGLEISPTQEFLGRYLTFVTIGIMQALVVTLGNLYLLKTYVIAPLPYVVFGVYTSIIFMMIIYTLVSVFGNVGKAIAMVVMVLQVAASGGTFPIQLTSPFFQSINPMLPFTYAVGGMRETVGGILKDLLIFNIYKLSIYFVTSLVIGMSLKGKVNKIMKKFILKFKESGLAEH
ncbi:MAG: YhgE/Pip domain-containing protein [Clostridium lundense]|nr:YhgE/Pip domain-containing protein [Clostridium lundense]